MSLREEQLFSSQKKALWGIFASEWSIVDYDIYQSLSPLVTELHARGCVVRTHNITIADHKLYALSNALTGVLRGEGLLILTNGMGKLTSMDRAALLNTLKGFAYPNIYIAARRKLCHVEFSSFIGYTCRTHTREAFDCSYRTTNVGFAIREAVISVGRSNWVTRDT